MDNSTTPATATPDAAAPPPETTAATPTIDTTLPPGFSLYQPSLKKGIHRLLVTVTEFGPSVNQETGEFQGWAFTGTLLQPAPDDSGGQLEAGTRMPRTTMFTGPSQYRTAEQALENAVGCLMGLNNIPINKRNRASCATALAAYNALPPEKRLPLAGGPDLDASHYDQWKETQVVAVYQAKEGKDGELRVNCLGFEAASTAKLS